jgi:hypothetical protein
MSVYVLLGRESRARHLQFSSQFLLPSHAHHGPPIVGRATFLVERAIRTLGRKIVKIRVLVAATCHFAVVHLLESVRRRRRHTTGRTKDSSALPEDEIWWIEECFFGGKQKLRRARPTPIERKVGSFAWIPSFDATKPVGM